MVLEFLAPYMEYFVALFIIIAFVVAGKIVNVLLRRYVSRLTARSKSELDDMILRAVQRPIFIIIFLVGLHFALGRLSVLVPYMAEIATGFTVIYGLYGAFFAVNIINTVIEWYGKKAAQGAELRVSEHFLPIFKKITYLIVFGLAAVWILGQLGIQITTLIAALGIGGLALALALQPTLSNFFAGAHIVLDKPIRVGDYVELDSGEKGYVADIGWRSTKIRMLGNNMIIIPNNRLVESKITNYYYPTKEMSVVVPCGISYKSDLDKAERVTIQVAKDVLKKSEGAVKGFEPFVRYKEFGDSNINFSVILRVNKYVDKYRITHEFMKALKKRFDKEKIEIAFPQVDVHLKRK